MSKVFIAIIKFYQYFSKTIAGNSSLFFVYASGCRHYPTCSDYTIESIREFGALKGLYKGFVRILNCNPLSRLT